MQRKIFKLDKSAVIALPRELLRKVGIRRGQKVEVTASGKKIQIRDAKNNLEVTVLGGLTKK